MTNSHLQFGPRTRPARYPAAPRSFTLTELLVAMGIIAIIGGITAMSVRAVARDARLASATNTVAAALEAGRAIAIRENRTVIVAFRPVLDGNRTRIEIVTAAYAGDARDISPYIEYPYGAPSTPRIVDRFRPVPNVARRVLPADISIAGPFSAVDDELWLVPTDLVNQEDAPGRIVGVMFNGDGTTIMQDSTRSSHFVYVDFNDDGFQNPHHEPSPRVYIDQWFELEEDGDEPLIQMVRYLTVFDYTAARDSLDPSGWHDADTRAEELSAYITENAHRIHFNRYTGVPMR